MDDSNIFKTEETRTTARAVEQTAVAALRSVVFDKPDAATKVALAAKDEKAFRAASRFVDQINPYVARIHNEFGDVVPKGSLTKTQMYAATHIEAMQQTKAALTFHMPVDVQKLGVVTRWDPQVQHSATEYNAAVGEFNSLAAEYKTARQAAVGRDIGGVMLGAVGTYAMEKTMPMIGLNLPTSMRTDGLMALASIPIIATRQMGAVGKGLSLLFTHAGLRAWDLYDKQTGS